MRLYKDEIDAVEYLATHERVDIPSDVRALIELLVGEIRASWVESSEAEKLREALQSIVDHATPLGSDDDGFVSTGYLVSVGAIHRALGLLRGGLSESVSSPESQK